MDIKGAVTFAIFFSPPQMAMIAYVSSGQRWIAPLLIAEAEGMEKTQRKFPLTF
jgi:hypothetical protein